MNPNPTAEPSKLFLYVDVQKPAKRIGFRGKYFTTLGIETETKTVV